MHEFKVGTATVGALLTGSLFKLPWMQRAYAWPADQVARLVTDVRLSMAQDDTFSHYPLGTVMMARADGAACAAIIDGHQRIMTLTLIFAVLRDLEEDAEVRGWLDGFIAERGDTDDARMVRLAPQPAIENFFRGIVQDPRGTLVEPLEEGSGLSQSEAAVLQNRDWLREAFAPQQMADEQRRAFARYLAGSCWMVVEEIRDEAEAWHILDIAETTRMQFTEFDQAKVTLLSVMPANERDAASAIWEQCEFELGPEDCHALLGHLRSIAMPKKLRVPMELELCKLYGLDKRGVTFMTDVFKPNAERMVALRRRPVTVGKARDVIAGSLSALEAIDRQTWVPAALLWLGRHGYGDDGTPVFFRRLERLVWMMRLGAQDPEKQEKRLQALHGEIQKGLAVDRMRSLAIEPELHDKAVEMLSSTNFFNNQTAFTKKRPGIVLRRLETIYGSDPGPIDPGRLTVEHILPRNAPAGGEWERAFGSKEAVKLHTNRLGNLTLLSPEDNQRADTKGWPVKRKILSESTFSLARQAAYPAVWDAKAIEQRTRELIRDLFAEWDLDL